MAVRAEDCNATLPGTLERPIVKAFGKFLVSPPLQAVRHFRSRRHLRGACRSIRLWSSLKNSYSYPLPKFTRLRQTQLLFRSIPPRASKPRLS